MKNAMIAIALLFSFSLFAQEVPVESYSYTSSKVSFLKDVQVLYLITEEGRERFQELRENKYNCSRHPRQVVKCVKFLKDHTGLDLKTDLLRGFAPTFDAVYETEIESESDFISIYNVEQMVMVKEGQTNHYKLYVNQGGKTYADMVLKGHSLRFGFTDTQKLSMQMVMRKSKGKNHWIEYGVVANYAQY